MKINLPNQLTLLRLFLIPFFLACVVNDHIATRIAALVIFVVASLTDLCDGHVARSRGMVTTLGTFLDPLADKLLISAAFIAFVQVPDFHVPAWMVVLIIGREFLITGLRTLAALYGRVISAQPAGKFKTSSQVAVIITILVIMILHSAIQRYGLPAESVSHRTAWTYVEFLLRKGPLWLTFGATVLTVFSGYLYLKQNVDLLHEQPPKAR